MLQHESVGSFRVYIISVVRVLQHESVGSFRVYIHAVLGFFVVEEHLSNTTHGLVNKEHLVQLWNIAMGKVRTFMYIYRQ